jgi:hypothetical protein
MSKQALDPIYQVSHLGWSHHRPDAGASPRRCARTSSSAISPGMTSRQVATTLGLGRTTVLDIVKTAGVTLRPRGRGDPSSFSCADAAMLDHKRSQDD